MVLWLWAAGTLRFSARYYELVNVWATVQCSNCEMVSRCEFGLDPFNLWDTDCLMLK